MNDELLKQILAEQKKTNALLENLMNLFIKYDKEFNEEIVREHGLPS